MPDKSRPITKTHGGKFYLARRLIQLAPDDIDIFCENFIGGGSFYANFHIHQYKHAILNDLDAGTSALWHCLRNEYQALISVLQQLKYDEATFTYYRDMVPPTSRLELAVRHFVVNRMSRGGMGKAFAWSERLRGGQPGDLNAWKTAVVELYDLHIKLNCDRGMMGILNQDGIELVRKVGKFPKNFLFLDPPYYPASRKSKKVYKHEMSVRDHRRLLARCLRAKCRIMLCGYHNELYDRVLARPGWRCVEFNLPNNSGQNKKKERRIEVVWLNY